MSIIYESEFNNNTLRKLQLTQLEILDEIVRICEMHNLKYYLVGGTLLGAVRHKGFIPWDDDLDIAMPRSDYERFCDICLSGELDPKYYLHNHQTDDTYWLIFGKIRKNNTIINERNIEKINTPKGIYVDIFPFDTVSNKDTIITRIRTMMIKSMCVGICWKKGLRPPVTWRVRLIILLLKPFSIQGLTRLQLKMMKKHDNEEGAYYINYGSNYETIKQTIPKDKYEPAVMLEFEGKKYRAPFDYDYVLRQIYNDYMQLPPEEKRALRHKPVYIDFGD